MTSLGKRKLAVVCAGHLPGGGRQRRAHRLADCRRTPATPLPPAEIGARLRARFQSRLDLTSEQMQKINPLIDQAMRQVEAIRQETASHVFANVSNLHEQVLLVLTPEQKAKFERLERERREYLRQKFGPATNPP